ncbi:hypothetical protein [Rhizobium laguerreae]|uniref:hypothetical protein n=1 Tax=Rhizobium laguerreae TaxID=1076926 RepID=UPI001FEB5590|nr:hypothetical protein [Rhizobium laguerreae]
MARSVKEQGGYADPNRNAANNHDDEQPIDRLRFLAGGTKRGLLTAATRKNECTERNKTSQDCRSPFPPMLKISDDRKFLWRNSRFGLLETCQEALADQSRFVKCFNQARAPASPRPYDRREKKTRLSRRMPSARLQSAEAEETQNREHDNDSADKPDQIVHGKPFSCLRVGPL